MSELSQKDLDRQDFVDNQIFELIQSLSGKEMDWNIEMISDIRNRIQHWVVDYYNISDEKTFYPYLEDGN
jgi:hypothetical protein